MVMHEVYIIKHHRKGEILSSLILIARKIYLPIFPYLIYSIIK